MKRPKREEARLVRVGARDRSVLFAEPFSARYRASSYDEIDVRVDRGSSIEASKSINATGKLLSLVESCLCLHEYRRVKRITQS